MMDRLAAFGIRPEENQILIPARTGNAWPSKFTLARLGSWQNDSVRFEFFGARLSQPQRVEMAAPLKLSQAFSFFARCG
jgi:hypothetical protein